MTIKEIYKEIEKVGFSICSVIQVNEYNEEIKNLHIESTRYLPKVRRAKYKYKITKND